MGTPRISYAAPFTRSVVGSNVLSRDPFVLVDVGVSGGIEEHWRIFEPHLHGFGFDPLVKECERLRRAEKNNHIRYFDRFVGSPKYAALFPPEISTDAVKGWSNQPFERTSAVRAQKLLSISFDQLFNNQDPEVIHTRNRTSLDEFCGNNPVESVDFLKIDTDGHDYEVLVGADEVISKRQVLGLFVECQFHGVTHLHSNLFANVDRFLRERGFSLFDLETYRYTRGTLPGHFVYTIPAQTREGQVLWGDALYLRDFAAPEYARRWGSLSPTKLLKLACLFEIHGMPDCSAELLIAERGALEPHVDIKRALDVLARQMEPSAASFEHHDARFQASPQNFYPQDVRTTVKRLAPPSLRQILSRAKRRLVNYLIRNS